MPKKISGHSTPKPDDNIPEDFVLPTPKGLDGGAGDKFAELAEVMKGKLTQADSLTLEALATAVWLSELFRKNIAADGVMIEGKPNQAVAMLHKYQAQTLAITQQLGMTRKVRKVAGLPDSEGDGQITEAELDAREFDKGL